MNQRLLLALPHRQFVFTFPKLLRPYFRHNRRLFSEISRLIFAILQRFYDRAAKRPVRTGMVLAYQTSGEFLRWNPHFHCIVLEGGFDDRGKVSPYAPRRYPEDVGVLPSSGHQVFPEEKADHRPSGHQSHQLEALRLFRRSCDPHSGVFDQSPRSPLPIHRPPPAVLEENTNQSRKYLTL